MMLSKNGEDGSSMEPQKKSLFAPEYNLLIGTQTKSKSLEGAHPLTKLLLLARASQNFIVVIFKGDALGHGWPEFDLSGVPRI